MEKVGGRFKWPSTTKRAKVHDKFVLEIIPDLSPTDPSLRLFKLENAGEISEKFTDFKTMYFDVWKSDGGWGDGWCNVSTYVSVLTVSCRYWKDLCIYFYISHYPFVFEYISFMKKNFCKFLRNLKYMYLLPCTYRLLTFFIEHISFFYHLQPFPCHLTLVSNWKTLLFLSFASVSGIITCTILTCNSVTPYS